MNELSTRYSIHRIAIYSRKFSPGENFRLFRPGASWAKFFQRIILPSENFVALKFLHTQVFTCGCQAILVVQCFMIINQLFYKSLLNLQPSLMSLLSYFHIAPRVLPDPGSCGIPIVGAITFRHHRSQRCCERQCSKLRTRKLRSERSIVSSLNRAHCAHCTHVRIRCQRME